MEGPHFRQVDTQIVDDIEQFEKLTQQDEPFILKSCNFGDCLQKWKLEYLIESLGGQQVVIHESEESDLKFLEKNFTYQKCEFAEFANKIQTKSSHVYLRSTNSKPRAKKPADIAQDFPSIADDLKPPDYIPYGSSNDLYYSSVLRIASANVQVWTHFDLYDNVLCQLVGSKRIVLFPPQDSKYLYMDGDKSPVNDLDNWGQCCSKYPLLAQATPYRCQLNPGDAIFIPALWWHNIRTISDSNSPLCSIGFNIFWKDKQMSNQGIYAENDVYGNKNLVPFDAALSNVNKALSHLEKLPGKYCKFHKIMLFERMKNKLLE